MQFQTLDISSQHFSSSASVCNRASTTGFKNIASTLEIVHKHGPCAHTQTDKNRPINIPSFAKILANDQLRLKSIQSQVAKTVDSINTNKDPNKSRWDKKAKLPALSGVPLHSGDSIVTIGLGTPKRRLSLIFDTGSYLTWTQCQLCARHCYQQNDTIFNPSASNTYSNISCKSEYCTQHSFGCYHNVTCIYGVGYGDGSYTIGFLSKDKLTLTPTDVFPGFLFGCSQNNAGLFGQTDGILGLSRDPISFLYQTKNKYKQYFSYCLPPTPQKPGFLAFGKNNKTTKKDGDQMMIFTPFAPTPQGFLPTFYYIEITAICVGGTRLAIHGSVFKMAPTIIDSGTVITYLPTTAYNAMSKEFKRQMRELNYTNAPAFQILDTCYHISGHTSTTKVPTVKFTFKGNATINLDPSGILVFIDSTYACLAFARNSDPEDIAIFGNTQQMKFEVAYDVAGGKLGFAYNPYCQ